MLLYLYMCVCVCMIAQSDVYGLGLVMFSVFSRGRKPYFNLPWEEAVINTLRREEK